LHREPPFISNQNQGVASVQGDIKIMPISDNANISEYSANVQAGGGLKGRREDKLAGPFIMSN
jgi:hypothetical protein